MKELKQFVLVEHDPGLQLKESPCGNGCWLSQEGFYVSPFTQTCPRVVCVSGCPFVPTRSATSWF